MKVSNFHTQEEKPMRFYMFVPVLLVQWRHGESNTIEKWWFRYFFMGKGF